MNIMAALDGKMMQLVFVDFVCEYIPLYEPLDGTDQTLCLFNRVFNKPCRESFLYTVKKLIELDVTFSVLYWVLAALNALKDKIEFTSINIHYYVMMLHCIGQKFIEDIPYDASLYLIAQGLDPKLTHKLEMDIFMKLLDVTNPHKLLVIGEIDVDLFLILGKILNRPVDEIIKINYNFRRDRSCFYNFDDNEDA